MRTKEPVYAGEQLSKQLATLPAWQGENGWLLREYVTDGWRSTMLAVNAIAFLAEAANHHPDLEVHWNRIVVRLQTHSAGGVTDKDLQLATKIESTVTWQPEGGFPGLEGQPSGWVSR